MSEAFQFQEYIPYMAQWDITGGCNFQCVFCLTASGKCHPNELTTEQALGVIDKLYNEGIWFLKIMGGEPFLRKDILTLLRYAASKGILISFSTNASLVNDEVSSTLYELRNSLFYIQMSLYGENKKTYELITGSQNNMERALKGLANLVNKGLDVAVLTVVTIKNAHLIPDYYKVVRSFGIKEFRLAPEVSLGRSTRKTGESGIWSGLIVALKKVRELMAEGDPPLYLDARPLFGEYLYKITGFRNFYENCTAATSMIYLDPSGNVLPCPFLKQLPPTLGNLYGNINQSNIVTSTFPAIWHSEAFNTFRSYYDPNKNLFQINKNCKFFKKGTCIPCAITPCSCVSTIKALKSELSL
jgi:MoaA/NifB/PqqE/SkfB family radical SAM enzyme